MMEAHDYAADCCDICETLVEKLREVYENENRDSGEGVVLEWSFRNNEQALSNPVNHFEHFCQWCCFFKKVLPSWMDARDNDMTLRVRGTGSSWTREEPELFWKMTSLHIEMGSREQTVEIIGHCDFNPLSTDVLGKIKRAIHICVGETHSSCPGFEAMKSPLRLLNVMSDDEVKLEVMSEREVKYAALSYCWGESKVAQTSKTVKSNIKTRLNGFPLSQLPRTLQDSIRLTRALDIQYIWIDALCIEQDTGDYDIEAKKMMHYYGNAYLTIVPVESETADDGMEAGGREPLWESFPGPWSRKSGKDLYLMYDTHEHAAPGSIIWRSKWNKRAWTLQEKINSTRILYVLQHKAVLACREGSWDSLLGWNQANKQAKDRPKTLNLSEFLPLSDASVTVASDSSVVRYSDWCTLVHQFTRRDIWSVKDKLAAFSGIMERCSQLSRRRNILGLWEDSMIQELASWVSPPIPIEQRENHLPSWTWLGANWKRRKNEGIWLHVTHVVNMSKPSAILESVLTNDIPGLIKLQIRTIVLSNDLLKEIVPTLSKIRGRNQLEGRRPGMAHFDCSYGEKCKCSSDTQHGTTDCDSYCVISSIDPPVSALLLGRGNTPGRDRAGRFVFFFLLIQPEGKGTKGSSGSIGLPIYRRVGTLNIPEEHLPRHSQRLMEQLSGEMSSVLLA
ncbi:heterokaryon incompatibility protein-domain-containing protein [Dendryphion nanum]|uniref:Heterokaryon incompatibility protein-domain-containing protein n=1 Tax=Dendryphion nanum TaxID=256645 RepID=A0A9P9D0P3_9PLEO|nr:heterokaryon incompatibility protein-domain-containing protein [Dendryphion nanum]